MDDTGLSFLYGSACAMPGEGPMSDIGGTAAAATTGVRGSFLPPRRSSSTAISPMMAMTAAPPTAMPAIAPVPSFDPPPLEVTAGLVLAAEPAPTVTTLGMVVLWPGMTVMTETLAGVPAELCSVTVDITVFELAPKVTMEVLVVGCAWATVLTTVVCWTGAGVVMTTWAGGFAQPFHCACVMDTGIPVPAQFVLN
jgi:hypothetical protein